MEVVNADTVRDGGSVNSNSGGEIAQSSHIGTCTSFTPEQVALFTLHYENGYDLFVDSVSWLLETHPEDVPADLMVGVSDPFQPFDNKISLADIITDSSAFDIPDCYIDE